MCNSWGARSTPTPALQPSLRMMGTHPFIPSHTSIGLGSAKQIKLPLGIFLATPTSRRPCLPAQLTGMGVALEMTLNSPPHVPSSLTHRKMAVRGFRAVVLASAQETPWFSLHMRSRRFSPWHPSRLAPGDLIRSFGFSSQLRPLTGRQLPEPLGATQQNQGQTAGSLQSPPTPSGL